MYKEITIGTPKESIFQYLDSWAKETYNSTDDDIYHFEYRGIFDGFRKKIYCLNKFREKDEKIIKSFYPKLRRVPLSIKVEYSIELTVIEDGKFKFKAFDFYLPEGSNDKIDLEFFLMNQIKENGNYKEVNDFLDNLSRDIDKMMEKKIQFLNLETLEIQEEKRDNFSLILNKLN